MEGGKVRDRPSAARPWVGDFKVPELRCGARPDGFAPISASMLYAYRAHMQAKILIQGLREGFLRRVSMLLASLRELSSGQLQQNYEK